MSRVSQNTQILEYIEEHKSITARDAMMHLGVYRLASRIAELKAKGYPIETTMELGANGARYARYSLGG